MTYVAVAEREKTGHFSRSLLPSFTTSLLVTGSISPRSYFPISPLSTFLEGKQAPNFSAYATRI